MCNTEPIAYAKDVLQNPSTTARWLLTQEAATRVWNTAKPGPSLAELLLDGVSLYIQAVWNDSIRAEQQGQAQEHARYQELVNALLALHFELAHQINCPTYLWPEGYSENEPEKVEQHFEKLQTKPPLTISQHVSILTRQA